MNREELIKEMKKEIDSEKEQVKLTEKKINRLKEDVKTRNAMIRSMITGFEKFNIKGTKKNENKGRTNKPGSVQKNKAKPE